MKSQVQGRVDMEKLATIALFYHNEMKENKPKSMSSLLSLIISDSCDLIIHNGGTEITDVSEGMNILHQLGYKIGTKRTRRSNYDNQGNIINKKVEIKDDRVKSALASLSITNEKDLSGIPPEKDDLIFPNERR